MGVWGFIGFFFGKKSLRAGGNFFFAEFSLLGVVFLKRKKKAPKHVFLGVFLFLGGSGKKNPRFRELFSINGNFHSWGRFFNPGEKKALNMIFWGYCFLLGGFGKKNPPTFGGTLQLMEKFHCGGVFWGKKVQKTQKDFFGGWSVLVVVGKKKPFPLAPGPFLNFVCLVGACF